MRYVFDEFEIDTEAYELIRAGRRVKVQPKVLQLIRYLIAHRERFVSKEEILAALWPSEHVTESSLFVCVRAARIALGQHHSANRPIATLRGAGYRFVGDLLELSPEEAAARRASGQANGGSWGRAPAAHAEVLGEFVGRQAVMQTLANALGRAREGRGQLVILSGEAGIGKTRCAQELCELAARDRVRVWNARCIEADGAPAFWPFVQLLREVAAAGDPPAAQARALLEQLVPGASAQPEPAAWSSDGFWLFDRVVRVLLDGVKGAACLIVLDDLQWADESSLRLLQLLASEVDRAACLIVATLREPRRTAEDARERTLRKLARSALVIELGGLSESETAQLLRAVGGAEDVAALAAELHRKTSGNPFLLVELLRLVLAGEGDGAPSAARLPRVVRDVIRGRLEVLDEPAQEVLRAASVFGGEFDLAALGSISELDGPELLAAVDAALAGRLIARGASEGRFAFSHDLVREVIYDDLSELERVRYHHRAGAALEARASSEGRLTELAYHFHRALGAGVHEKALQHAAAAAAGAMRAFAFDTAARCYRWALGALDHRPGDDPRTRAELTLGLATAVLALGRSTEARTLYKAAVEIADEHDFGDLLATAGIWLRSNVATAPLPDAFSLRVLERALELLSDEERELRANVLSRLAWIWPNCDDMPRCKELAARSLALARTLRSDSTLLGALSATLYSLTGPDDTEALLQVSDEVFAIERKSGRLSWYSAQAHFLRYHAHLQRNERPEAERALEQFGEAVGKLRMPEPVLLYDRLKAQRLMDQGRLDEAERLFVEQYGRGQRLGLAYADLYYALQCVLVSWQRTGLSDVPGALVAEGWAISSTPVFRATRLCAAAELGRAAELRHEWEALCQDDFATIPRDLNYLLALARLSPVAIELRDEPRVRALYERLAPYARRNTLSLLSFTAGSVSYYLGTLAEFLGDLAQAGTHYETALADDDAMGYVPCAARTRLRYAALLLAGDGAHDRARAMIEDAEAAARQHGLAPLSQQAAALRARVGMASGAGP